MTKKIEARINAANLNNWSDKIFSDLYQNESVVFFGSEDEMKALKERAKALKLNK